MAPLVPAFDTVVGPLPLRSPLVAASGTVGSVWEWATVADVSFYGAAVAKSVSGEPWPGKGPPRVAPTKVGMLNGIGIQNPGIDAWESDMTSRIAVASVPIWGSAVGHTPDEFSKVAAGEERAGVTAIEVNLSCPNLDDGRIFALDAGLSSQVVASVAAAVDIPVGAKLSPASEDIVAIAKACLEAGAQFITLTNTIPGLGIDIDRRSPNLSGGAGGYSGPGLMPVSLRCVYDVAKALPSAPIIGCGGVSTGSDVVEYLMAGASAVGLGTVHFAEPKAGARIARQLRRELQRLGLSSVRDAVGAAL